MNDIWVSYDHWQGEILEYYDCEQTAWLAYCKWCKLHNTIPNEKIFKVSYVRLSDIMTIMTAKEVEKDEFYPA